MKRYSFKSGVLLCGDNTDAMQGMLRRGWSVDLVVTSPPYDNLRNYNGYSFDFPKTAGLLTRLLVPGGVIVWVVNDATIQGSETGTSFRQVLYFKDVCGLNLHDTMIFQKTATSAAGSMNCYLQSFEYMFILSKGVPRTINIIRDRENKTAGQINTSAGRRNKNGVRGKDVCKIKRLGRRYNIWKYDPWVECDRTGHPAEFPKRLAADHIRSWSNPGDVVFDPFLGSGTVARAAEVLDRLWVGCEISEEYCQIITRKQIHAEAGFAAHRDKTLIRENRSRIGL